MRAGEAVLVANAGSSSLKFEAFAAGPDGDLASIGGGQFEGIGTAPRLRATAAGRAIAASFAVAFSQARCSPGGGQRAARRMGTQLDPSALTLRVFMMRWRVPCTRL